MAALAQPQDNEWGRRLWRILHVIGAKHKLAIHNALIISFLENLHNVLPCKKCQKHCHDYWISHRLRGPPSPPPPSGHMYRGRRMIPAGAGTAPSTITWDPARLRDWLWDFHNAVNVRRSHEDVSGSNTTATALVFPHESLTIYETADVREDIEFIYTYIARYALQHGLKPGPFQVFRAQLDRLRVIYRF